MIGNQHALAELLFQPAHFALQVFDGDRIDAAEWFVEENQFGLGAECAGDFHFSPFAAAECPGPLFALFDQSVLAEQLLSPADAFGPA